MLGGAIQASADGATGAVNGFLSASVYVVGVGGGASADATMDFRPTGWSVLNLNTSGERVGFALNFIQLQNLTDGIELLYFEGNPASFDHWDFTDSFSFTLDPSKEYRLKAHGYTVPDAGSARVDYAVLPVPESSTIALMISGISAVLLRVVGQRSIATRTKDLK